MSVQESLTLVGRFEAPHLAFALPCGLMGDFGPVVGVTFRDMNDRRHDGPVCRAIAPELVGDQPPGCASLTFQELAEEPLSCAPISTRLHENVEDVAVLIDSTPEILPLTLDRHKELV